MKQLVTLLSVFIFSTTLQAQSYVVRDIKSFGAKGDGKTNDHEAFTKAAAFFNKRGGRGKLIISAGTYIVGKQNINKSDKQKAMYQGEDVLWFIKCTNLTVEGRNANIRFRDSLRYGSFEPLTGKIFRPAGYFVEGNYAASVGRIIFLSECKDVTLSNLQLYGNSEAVILGGSFGDTGYQIPYTGIHAVATESLMVNNCTASYFGLDGIMVGNDEHGVASNKITLKNSVFEYNSRQGLSWVGGANLTATGCKFNHTGRGKFKSAPGAGVDVEAETGPISNGKFINCEFINNFGCGLVADTGPSRDCTFENCTFWGTTEWSVWINKPGFTIKNSKIYGSIVHGFSADNETDATKYIGCHFEDKAYNGKEPFGEFLIETNYRKRMRFENCTMLSHKKKIVWIESPQIYTPDERYQIVNCRLTYEGNNLPANDFVGLTRGARLFNSSFTASNPDAKAKNYWFVGLLDNLNINAGGNKVVIAKETKPW